MNEHYEACIEPCRKNDAKTMKLDVNGRSVYIHSRYDPIAEADKQVEKLTVGPGANYIIVGLGMGYHIRALLKRLNVEDFNKIAVFEPNDNVYELFINDEANIDLLEDERIKIERFTTIPKTNEILNMLYDTSTSYLNNFLFFLPVYKDIYTEKCRDMAANIKSHVLICTLATNTTFKFSEIWFKCQLENTNFLYESYSGKRLENLYEGIPAVVVSAGPSLAKNIDLINELYDKAVIIAVDTALRPLYLRSVKSHFAISIDAQPKVYKKFANCDGLEKDLIINFLSATELIKKHTGRKIAFSHMNLFLDECFEDLGIELLRLESGGSVACSALDVAYKIGADPIIFLGQDLAYTGMKTHIENTAFYNKKDPNLDTDFYVDGIYGDKVPTAYNLNQYREWIEMFIHMFPKRTYIDATEGGAKIAGTEIKTFRETIDEYCTKTYDIEGRKEVVFSEDNKSATKEQFEGYVKHIKTAGDFIRKKLPEIKACKIVCDKMIREIESNGFKRPEKIVKPYDRIKKLNTALKQNEHSMDLILPLVALYREEAARTDHLRDKTLTDEKKLSLDLEKYRDYYEALADKIKYALPFIEEAVEKNSEVSLDGQ